MKWLDYLYYNIYNWYYKDGNSNGKVDPTFMVSLMFAFSGSWWAAFLTHIISRIVYHYDIGRHYKEYIYFFLIPGIVFGVIINELYLSDLKYMKVYRRFSNEAGNKKAGFVLSFSFIFLPMVLWILTVWLF